MVRPLPYLSPNFSRPLPFTLSKTKQKKESKKERKKQPSPLSFFSDRGREGEEDEEDLFFFLLVLFFLVTVRGRAEAKAEDSEMEAIAKNSHLNQKPEALSHLREGIASLLSRWNGLQLAVQNQWGGHESLEKSRQLAADILSWLSQSKGQLLVDDLESFLHESMLFSFNTEIEDGSIEEVAEQLMIIHEEYLNRSQ